MPSSPSLSYRDAGVDIERGNALVESIKKHSKPTMGPEILAGVGGFGALFELPVEQYKKPVLVSGADGVGTKLKLAIVTGIHDTIGIDLVAMCANDVLTCGAKPLFFLDYFATGKLDLAVAEQVVEGIARGCELAGAALIGGETAEMPGLYGDGDYDLAGFCVGVVEKERIIHGRDIRPGDVLLGLASTGAHSNGYSLIRKVLERSGQDDGESLNELFHDNKTLGQTLLAPTSIYVRPVLALIEQLPVQAIAHITGGGLLENVPRVLPAGVCARIDTSAWSWPPIFHWLRTAGGIDSEEMYRTFNCGIGMVVCVRAADVSMAMGILNKYGQSSWEIGVIEAADDADLPPKTIIV